MKIDIRERRKVAGIRQEEMAKHLGISVAQYSRMERNVERIRGEHLRKIAEVLGCTTDDITGRSSADTTDSKVSVRRTISVLSQSRSSWRGGMLEKVGEYAPTSKVSTNAYAVEVDTDDMSGDSRRALNKGDWVVVDPAIEPVQGDCVHAIDLATDENIFRFFHHLHPTNPRAPGFVLRALNPMVDEIYVRGDQARDVLLGTVTEVRVILRK